MLSKELKDKNLIEYQLRKSEEMVVDLVNKIQTQNRTQFQPTSQPNSVEGEKRCYFIGKLPNECPNFKRCRGLGNLNERNKTHYR
jgi:hypothetical protein